MDCTATTSVHYLNGCRIYDLISSTTLDVVDTVSGFITDGHLGTMISVALAVGLISFVVYRLVRKY